MELEHSFSVPVPVERAWEVLLDVERVAPCMPGATLDSVDGEDIAGRIKIKVGPIQMTYAGTARFTERDKETGVVTLEASGKETRGAGTAAASVRSQLTPDGTATKVTVHTTLNVTGKPAQFGRGVMTEVGTRLIGIFAENLAAMLAASEPAPDPVPAESATEAAPAGGAGDAALPIDVLNLSTRAWSSLRRDGIQTLGDLTRRTEQQLTAIDGVGPASLADIQGKLADRGLALADSAAADERPAGGRHAGTEQLAGVTPLRPSRHEAVHEALTAEPETSGWQPPDNDAIDLLDVAGLPVLKRAVPAAAALIAVLLVLAGLRRRRARRR
jgi:carbon monoxide dehydrogenase subunit G